MTSEIVENVLDHSMREFLRGKSDPPVEKLSMDAMLEKVKIARQTFPQPTSRDRTVIKAEMVGETAKAYNLKVYLDPSKYNFVFPFKPVLYVWVPKSISDHIRGNYWEVKTLLLFQNLGVSMEKLKQKLLSNYQFTESELGILSVYILKE